MAADPESLRAEQHRLTQQDSQLNQDHVAGLYALLAEAIAELDRHAPEQARALLARQQDFVADITRRLQQHQIDIRCHAGTCRDSHP